MKDCNERYAAVMQAISQTLMDFASKNHEFQRAVRHLYTQMQQSCGKIASAEAPPPPGDSTEEFYRPSVAVPGFGDERPSADDLPYDPPKGKADPPSRRTKRPSSAELRPPTT